MLALLALALPATMAGQGAAPAGAPPIAAPTAVPAAAAAAFAPLSAFAARKAVALLRDKLPCLGCHSLGGEGGKVGPDLSTVRERRSPAYIAAMIAAPHRVSPGSAMPRTAMAPRVEALIVRYLANLPGRAPLAPAPAPAQTPPAAAAVAPADGAALYARWCSFCHGQGRGDGVNAPYLPVRPGDHTDAKRLASRPDDSLYDTIAAGGAVMNLSHRMPAFGDSLRPHELRALVAHLRTLCKCEAPLWSRDAAAAGAVVPGAGTP